MTSTRKRWQLHYAGVVLMAVAIVVVVLPGVQARSSEGQGVVIDIDGQQITLVLGENVHAQTYELLSRNPEFASDPNVKWVFVDKMWVPVARSGYEGQPSDSPELIPGIDYIPECDIALNVTAFSQTGQPWSSDRLYNKPGCRTIQEAGCALTSVAMVFRYYGQSTDPGVLNSCCGSNGCYVDCGTEFACAAGSCSGGQAAFVNIRSFS